MRDIFDISAGKRPTYYGMLCVDTTRLGRRVNQLEPSRLGKHARWVAKIGLLIDWRAIGSAERAYVAPAQLTLPEGYRKFDPSSQSKLTLHN